jgi:Ca-activated chloride channel family protein
MKRHINPLNEKTRPDTNAGAAGAACVACAACATCTVCAAWEAIHSNARRFVKKTAGPSGVAAPAIATQAALQAARSAVVAIVAVLCGLLIGSALGCGGGGADGSSNNVGSSGAQDIGYFRLILDEGEIPAENTLDANGFFSEHHTALPPADCGEPICLHAMLAVDHDWVRGHYQAALQVAFNTTIDASALEPLDLDLIVVVDTSGSMASDYKMDYAKDGLDLLIEELGPNDRMALVAYSDEAVVLSDLQSVSDATGLHDAVDNLIARGSTNLHEGLQTGLQMAANALAENRETRVVLLSDGVPTVGETDPEAIQEMAAAFIGDGIGLTTVGMGMDFNVELMQGLAEMGAGNFYFLDQPEAIEEVFTQELDYFAVPIAYDVTLQVRSGAGYTLGDVVGTRFWTTESYGGEVEIPTLFLASRISQEDQEPGRRGGGSSFFVQMLPLGSLEGIEDRRLVAEVTFTYRLPDDPDIHEQTIRVENPADPGQEVDHPYYTHQAIEKNYAVYNIFMGLREACRQAEENHNYALWVLEQLEDSTRAWEAENPDEDIEADLMLIAQFAENLRDKGAYAMEPGTQNYAHDDIAQPIGCAAAPGAPVHHPLAWLLLSVLSCGIAATRRQRRR